MSEYVKELQMHIRDREYKIEKLKSDYDALKAKLEKAEIILKEMLEDGLCLQGQEHDFAIGIREYMKGEG